MNAELLFDAIYAVGFVGIFVLLLYTGEGIFNLLYRVSPGFRRWWDNYCEGLPDWDNEGYLNE